MLHANLMTLSFLEPELWATKVYIVWIGILDLFCCCDLDIDPTTFMYELDPYSRETHRMCKYELPTSRLSKAIVWQTDIDLHTDRQTRPKPYTTPLRGWSIMNPKVNASDSRSSQSRCWHTYVRFVNIFDKLGQRGQSNFEGECATVQVIRFLF